MAHPLPNNYITGYDDYYSYYGGSDNEYDDEKLTPNEDWSILNCAKRQRVHQVASIIELIRSNPAYNVNCKAEFKQSFEEVWCITDILCPLRRLAMSTDFSRIGVTAGGPLGELEVSLWD
ncbi:hypothetical protein YC2023_060208 [Brassica napus]